MGELKNCPFCGSEARESNAYGGNWVECVNYNCGTQLGGSIAMESAIKLWNTRKPDPGVKAVYEYIKRECESEGNYPHNFADEQWEAIKTHVEKNQ